METPRDRELDTFYRVIAPYYDEDHAGFLQGQDLEIYRELAAGCGGPVLDMGCGTGRVLLELARAGFTVHGIDCSGAMLEQLCSRLRTEPAEVRERISMTRGDIRSVSVDRQFPLVVAAGMVLHSFVERADQRAWLRNVRRHLAAGGLFCFDTFQFDYARLLAAPEWAVDVDRVDARSGHRIRRFVRCLHEAEHQRFRVDMRWAVEDAAGAAVRDETASVMQRWFTRSELENLLELEGFHLLDYRGVSADRFWRMIRAAAGAP